LVEWYVYYKDEKGRLRRRKARAEEIPKPLESGVSLEDGTLIQPARKRGSNEPSLSSTRKRGDKLAKRKDFK